MKKIVKLAGISLVLLVIATLVSLRTFGLEPQDQRPGLWLAGERVTEPVSDWTFTDDFEEIFVQTNTRYGIPHSITTYCAEYNGRFYLFSAYYQGGVFPDTRGWNRNVIRDPRVRLKIGDNVYDQTLSYVSDESAKQPVIQKFEAKYPGWKSPGSENVHIFLVQDR
jgi:hypothetical protein